MPVKVVRTAKLASRVITLQDLDDLVRACTDFPRTAKVSITASHDQREGSYYTLVVTE